MPSRAIIPVLVRPYSEIAPTYDVSVGFRDFVRTRRTFEALVRQYGIEFRSAVDLGCGTGLFARYLSQHWNVPVFAVDNCPEMLRVAENNCRNYRVCFFRQDIRALCLPAQVDLATANTFTLNHMLNGRDLYLAFRRIHQNLRPGGYLLFDLLTDCQPPHKRRPHNWRMRIAHGELHHRIRWDPRRKLLSITILHRTQSPAPPKLELYQGRGWSPLKVASWLRDAGFRILGIHDAKTLRIANGCPAKVVVIARKGLGGP